MFSWFGKIIRYSATISFVMRAHFSLLVIANIFIIHNLHAISYPGGFKSSVWGRGMYSQKSIESTLKSLSSIKENDHCHYESTGGAHKKDSFYATHECEIKCMGESNRKTINVETRYDVFQRKLHRGDGGLWASLTIDLDQW